MALWDTLASRGEEAALGAIMLRMLTALGRRGPDSAGVALLAHRADGAYRLRVKLGEPAESDARVAEILRRVRGSAALYARARWRISAADARLCRRPTDPARRASRACTPRSSDLLCRALDIVKQVGSPENLEQRFGISRASGARCPTRLDQPYRPQSLADLSGLTARWMWLRRIMATLPIITNCAGITSSVACISTKAIRKLLYLPLRRPCKRVPHSPKRCCIRCSSSTFVHTWRDRERAWFRQRPLVSSR